MSHLLKRKRGRPRTGESREINDFDVLLIKEFRRYPALYNRDDEQYKNREYAEQLWQNMASQLGYNVEALKSRMNQLRTRYTQEKRRLEHLKIQYQDPTMTSEWALYKDLEFLGDHIKARRPYPKGRTDGRKRSNSSEVDEDEEVPERKPFVEQETPVTNGEASQDTRPSTSCENYKPPLSEPDVTEPIISVDYPTQNPTPNGGEVFRAFGLFVAASLNDMPERSALSLVEKFTSQLCKTLTTEKYKQN